MKNLAYLYPTFLRTFAVQNLTPWLYPSASDHEEKNKNCSFLIVPFDVNVCSANVCRNIEDSGDTYTYLAQGLTLASKEKLHLTRTKLHFLPCFFEHQ